MSSRKALAESVKKMVWFEELGFDENPFDGGLAVSARKSVGLDKPLAELLYYVNAGSIVFVEGASGSGKTALLHKLSQKLGKRAIYADLSEKADIRSLIRKKASIIDRLFGNNPKRIVLLLDNAASLSPSAAEVIKYHYDNNNVESVVIAGTSIKAAGLPSSILDRIGDRVLRLAPLAEEEAIAMVKNRIGSSVILEEAAIRKIYRMSGKNGKKFLQLCEEACKAAAASKSQVVTEEEIAAVKNLVGGIDG